ncbi:substrate-binding domain-containing protein [Nonomuraea thailandensis]|uniref:substrate-binding domain-containing protein n=1 Tax=Nonomuraea thailandensis TaxID=1188745 RepID=UPI0023E0FCB9
MDDGSSARELGRRVPEDLAIVGFDDVDAASATTPALTTVRVPVAEQALAPARLLLSRLEGRHTTSAVLPTRLVVRDSAQPAGRRGPNIARRLVRVVVILVNDQEQDH